MSCSCHPDEFTHSFFSYCNDNKIDKVRRLLPKININETDEFGYSALSYCCGKGHYELAQLLIVHGADVNHKTGLGRSCLWRAITGNHEHMVQLLLSHGADTNLTDIHGRKVWEELEPDLEKKFRKFIGA